MPAAAQIVVTLLESSLRRKCQRPAQTPKSTRVNASIRRNLGARRLPRPLILELFRNYRLPINGYSLYKTRFASHEDNA